jgi:Holliday junction resolvase RusA-like endonuclease
LFLEDLGHLVNSQELYVPIPPVPASRPRVARFGTYYSKRHQSYVRSFTAFLKYYEPAWEYLPRDRRLAVGLEFACKRPKKISVNSPPFDIDNLIKLPLDCLTSAEMFWHDDVQVEICIGIKRYAKKGEEPHTVVRVWEIEEET